MTSDLGACILVLSRLVVIALSLYAIYVVLRYDMEPRRRGAGGHVLGGCLALIGVMGYLLDVGEVTSGLDQVIVNVALGVSLYGIAAFVRVTKTSEPSPDEDGGSNGPATDR